MTTAHRPMFWLTAVALFTSSWDAVRVGQFTIADVAAALALVAAVLAALGGAGLAGVAPLVGCALIVGVSFLSSLIFPAGQNYSASRYLPPNPLVQYGQVATIEPTVSTAFLRWFASFVLIPVLVILASRTRAGGTRQLFGIWAAGIVVNGVVVVYDAHLGGTIGADLLGFADVTGRDNGLSTSSNQIGVALALAVPAAAVLPRQAWRKVMALLILLAAAAATGSRGGFTVAIVALVAVAAVHPSFRKWRVTAGVFGGLGLAVFLLWVPSVASQLLTTTRIIGVQSTATSDSQRLLVFQQGIADLGHSPLHGIGVTVIEEAHSVPIEILASSGLIGMLGYLAYVLLVLRTGLRYRHDVIVATALLTMLVMLAIGLVENNITGRYLWVWAGFILAAAEPAARRVDRPVGSTTELVRR